MREAPRAAVDVAVPLLLAGRALPPRPLVRGVEARLDELDEHEVRGDHAEQDQEEGERERGEAERRRERRERQDRADRRAAIGRAIISAARTAAQERHAPRADHEDHERLRRQRLDEPAAPELAVAGVQDHEHHEERREVEDRADRPEDHHEAADEPDVPGRRAGDSLLVDVVGRDRHLTDVVEQVVEQDLRRQHRQEREEERRAGGAEHVAEVRRRRHQHVLDRVGEDAPAFAHAVGEHAEVLVEQDDVGRVLGDVGRRVDRDADVGVVQRDRVVDAVAHERDVGARAPRDPDQPRLLLGPDTREDRRRRDRRGERRRRRARRSRRPSACPRPRCRGRGRP